MSGSIINLKWTWLILAIICILFYFFVLISYYLTDENTTKKRGYGFLLTFSNWFILPLAIGLCIAYYVFAIVMNHSKHKISKASHKKIKSSDDD